MRILYTGDEANRRFREGRSRRSDESVSPEKGRADVTRPGRQPAQRVDRGRLIFINVFRSLGPCGLPAAILLTAIIFWWAREQRVSYNASNLNLILYSIFSLWLPISIIVLTTRSFSLNDAWTSSSITPEVENA
jgi:hypothetical protein